MPKGEALNKLGKILPAALSSVAPVSQVKGEWQQPHSKWPANKTDSHFETYIYDKKNRDKKWRGANFKGKAGACATLNEKANTP